MHQKYNHHKRNYHNHNGKKYYRKPPLALRIFELLMDIIFFVPEVIMDTIEYFVKKLEVKLEKKHIPEPIRAVEVEKPKKFHTVTKYRGPKLADRTWFDDVKGLFVDEFQEVVEEVEEQ